MDWERFVAFAYQTFAIWEFAYLSHKEKLISDEASRSWEGVGRSVWCGAGYQRFWDQERQGHAQTFQE